MHTYSERNEGNIVANNRLTQARHKYYIVFIVHDIRSPSTGDHSISKQKTKNWERHGATKA